MAAFVVIILLLALAAGYYLLFYEGFRKPEASEELEFHEEVPAWNMSSPALTKLVINPDRANPGDTIVFHASLRNSARAAAGLVELIFLVNDVEVGREAFGSLEPYAEVEATATWTAEKPGRHWVVAQLSLGEGNFDRDLSDNIQTGILRVSGGLPEPELEVELTDVESFHPVPGESYNVTLNFRNPSFTDVRNIPVKVYIDGEVVGRGAIEYLPQGERKDLSFQWRDVKPGGHVILAQMDLPEEFPYADSQRQKSWVVTCLESTNLYPERSTDKWWSIGPSLLTGGYGGLPTGSVGRVNTIAYHPNDTNIMYAGADTGGVWKTENGGDTWKPLTDKLLPFYVGNALVVDEEHPDIVYFGTGASDDDIYKSIDGGSNWAPFLNSTSSFKIGDVRRLAIRYISPSAGDFVIYAATDAGVLRYRGTDPWAKVSQPNEWINIRSGRVADIVVDPTGQDWMYASINEEGVFCTTIGLTATANDWFKVPFPSISQSTGKAFTIDVYWSDSPIVFGALTTPDSGIDFAVYRSEYPHSAPFTLQTREAFSFKKDEIGGLYNPFIRIKPNNPDVIYFGGIGLYKRYISSGKQFQIEGIHVDMHGMEWTSDPYFSAVFGGDTYFVCCDGGIWRCTYKHNAADDYEHRNRDLRVTQFYDFDASQTNPDLMIGGTQDCGTIMYTGDLHWKIIKGGDGAYSLIGPGDQIFYAQHQFLDDTVRSDKGAGTWWGDWVSASGTWWFDRVLLPHYKLGYITVHPKDAKTVLAQGDQVICTNDGGASWTLRGPSLTTADGFVGRVVINPDTFEWFAGTDKGQIWKAPDGGGVDKWSLVNKHPYNASVVSMAFAPTNSNVLYVAYLSYGAYSVQRLVRNQSGGYDGTWIGCPADVKVNAIAGSGHNASIVYVGTDKGVLQGDINAPTDMWRYYNDGLPRIKITDLLVDKTSKELRAATFGRGAWASLPGPEAHRAPPAGAG